MEATLEGQDITVRIRSSKYDEKIITWPESHADDYLHRPIDNLPLALGNTSNETALGYEIITPNRLKLGRNNYMIGRQQKYDPKQTN